MSDHEYGPHSSGEVSMEPKTTIELPFSPEEVREGRVWNTVQEVLGSYGEDEVIRAATLSLEKRAELRGAAAERARCAKIAREEESRWDRECTPDTVRPHPGNVAQRIALLIEAGE